MALNSMYFVTGDLTTYFVDKDSGEPLAGGTITFFRDSSRSTPKLAYELSGSPPNYTYTALPNPVPLSASGTPQDASSNPVIIYYYPYDASGNLDLYYIVIADSNGVVQNTVEAWPNVTAADNPTQNDFSISNQVSNSQFSQAFLPAGQTLVYTVSAATNQVFRFAPNWDFVISGTGTVTIQLVAISGSQQIPTSPPYVLDVALSGGVTVCLLRQRFPNNSGLWASTATQPLFLAGTLIAINENAGTSGIQMFYNESTGGTPISIVNASFDNSGYKVLTGVTAAAIPLSTNTDDGFPGYIDIYLSFLINSHVRIGSIQVVPTTNQAGGTNIPYELNSSNREQAYMGDYYIPRLNSRPTDSLLTGWDFTVNPFQFAATGNLTNTAAYICDQTIGWAGSTGNIGFARDTISDGLALTTNGTNDAFYILQYLSGNDAKKILGTPLSVNVFGYMTSVTTAVTMQVYLCRAPSTSSIPTLATTIGTVNTAGVLTLTAAGWTLIPQNGLSDVAVLPAITANSQINNFTNDTKFTGWQVTDNTQITDTDYFAIVVTFAYVDMGTTITINSISVTPSEIPARPAPKSLSDTLKACQYYYEKTYDQGVYAGATSTNGAVVVEQGIISSGPNVIANSLYVPVRYETTKRLAVTPTFYSTNGTAGNLFFTLYYGSTTAGSTNVAISGNWTVVLSGATGVALNPVNRTTSLASFFGGSPTGQEAIAQFHYTADARLGIV